MNYMSLKLVFTQKKLNRRKRRWPELIVNYNIALWYHLDKINVVPKTLNRKFMIIFLTQLKELLEEIQQLELDIVLPGLDVQMIVLQIQPH